MQSDLNRNNWLDKVGVAATSLCALHCIFLPVLLPLLPLLGLSVVAEETFEHFVLAASMLIGFIALFTGFHRYHRKLYPFYSLALGGFVYASKDVLGEAYEPLVVTVGAILIILAHILNMRLCKSCRSC
ncbi:MerC-like membrane protein [Catenovulum agarivorans DS-2]|uniref:MerC-like membrane protein n=1 Tax=Catenovulum agarivorans DS-2 TaxID=1328313 RepID=W7QHL8_9ALTE|nr:MerC domain-containing protein [Catenovulum agarivorans]EWH08447.1 MerC-like membrane protein [Catenovulum agarivorans DS-2]